MDLKSPQGAPSKEISLQSCTAQAEPPHPSDIEVVKNIEVLAAFVVKNGPQFEEMARMKQAKDPKFQFLYGGEAGSEADIAYQFYEWKKKQLLAKSATEQNTSLVQENQRPTSQPHSAASGQGQLSLKTSDTNTYDNFGQFSSSPGAIARKVQDTFSSTPLRQDSDLSKRQEHQAHSNKWSKVKDMDHNVDGHRRRDSRRRTGFDQPTMVDIDTIRAPIRSMQEESYPAVDKEDRSVGPTEHRIETATMSPGLSDQTDVHEEQFSSKQRTANHRREGGGEKLDGSGLVETGFQTRIHEASGDQERSGRLMRVGRSKEHQQGIVSTRHLQSGLQTIDEFGRLVRQGVMDSDSDEEFYSNRKRRRSLSRSRSHSPGGMRRRRRSHSRSPHRRGSYSRSYSRSPRQQRSQSPPPPWEMRRGGEGRGDRGFFGRGWRGRGRGGPVPICNDYSKGRCFRGSSCRFLHQDSPVVLGESSPKFMGGIRGRGRRDNFMGNDRSYPRRDGSWPTSDREPDWGPQKLHIVAGEGDLNWPNTGVEKRGSNEDPMTPHSGFSTHDFGTSGQTERVSATLMGELPVSNAQKPSCPISLPEESSTTFAPSCGSDSKIQTSSQLDSQMPSHLANQQSLGSQIPSLSSPSISQVSFPQPPLMSSTPCPYPTPAGFIPPPGNSASTPMAPPRPDQAPMFSGRISTSSAPLSWSPFSQQPASSVPITTPPPPLPPLPPPLPPTPPPQSMNSSNGVLSSHQHMISAPLPSAQAGLAPATSHSSVSGAFSEQQRLPSPTPASQHSVTPASQHSSSNYFVQQQGFAPLSPSPPQYVSGSISANNCSNSGNISLQQEVAANPTNNTTLLHQQRDVVGPPQKKQPSYTPNASQQSHSFINSSAMEITANMASHFRPMLERPLTTQPLSMAETVYLPGGAHTQVFPSGSVAASLSHVPLGSSESGMSASQNNLKIVLTSSMPLNARIAESFEPESAGGDPRSKSIGISVDKAIPSVTRPSPGNELNLPVVNMEPVFSEEPMSPGPAAATLQSIRGEPPGELVMESVSPGLPSRDVQHNMNAAPSVNVSASVENVSATLEIEKNSVGKVETEAVENEAEGAEFNLEEGQDKLKKEKDGKPGAMLLRVAVTEYVKEVLKPTWKEGHMSKEAFKTIAKKAVDKVLGTLQSHQVPKTQDKVDHFMSFSRPKIAKLVQGYVDKYVKL